MQSVAGIGMDIINFIWVTVLFAVIMYFIANFMIQKFNYATPGRNGNYETAEGSEEASSAVKVAAGSQAVNIINLSWWTWQTSLMWMHV